MSSLAIVGPVLTPEQARGSGTQWAGLGVTLLWLPGQGRKAGAALLS